MATLQMDPATSPKKSNHAPTWDRFAALMHSTPAGNPVTAQTQECRNRLSYTGSSDKIGAPLTTTTSNYGALLPVTSPTQRIFQWEAWLSLPTPWKPPAPQSKYTPAGSGQIAGTHIVVIILTASTQPFTGGMTAGLEPVAPAPGAALAASSVANHPSVLK
jgi:hypothetical protein